MAKSGRVFDFATILAQHDGVMSTSELLAAGATRHTLAAALKGGLLLRPRRGWYCLPDRRLTDAGVARLLGGSLTCVSALAHQGIWVPAAPNHRHVRLSRHLADDWPTSPLHSKLAPTVRVHAQSKVWRSRSTASVDAPLTALLVADQCVSAIELVAIIDSIRHHGTPLSELEYIGGLGTASLRAAVARSRVSESGAESLVREWLRAAGIPARTQVLVGRWRLDLVIGEWLVIEVDGFAYHSDRGPFDRDRFRDRELALAGYTVLRITTVDLSQRWPQVLEQIRAAMAAGWHLRQRRGAISA